MKKSLILITLLLITTLLKAQTTTYTRGDTVTITNINKTAVLKIQNATKDSTGGVLYNIGAGQTIFKKLKVPDITGLHDSLANAGTITSFTIVTLPIVNQFIAGGTINQTLQQIYNRAVPPTYTVPTATFVGTPSVGSYERGTTFSGSQITLSFNFIQNDGGTAISESYLKNGSSVTSPANLTLSSNTTFQVMVSYGQGPIKNDSHGNPYPTGRISAGTANSPVVTYSIFDKGYAGYATNTLVSGKPITSDILGFPITDNSGGSSINTQNTAQQGSDKYYCFITTTTRSTVTVNGTPSTAAFNMNLPITFTNASGGTFSGYAHVSKNPGGSTGAVTYVFN